MIPNDWKILADYGVTPDHLHVGGSLFLMGVPITALPEGLRVGGDLFLSNTVITALPEGLRVGGWLFLNGTAITALPEGLHVRGSLVLDGTAIKPLYTDPRGHRLDRAGNRYHAGCRRFTAAEALHHWGSEDYPNKKRGAAYCEAVRAEEARRNKA